MPLGLRISLLASATLARSWVRWAAIVSTLPYLAVTGVAAWWGIEVRQRDREVAAYEAATHQILDHDQVVNGLSLPIGTAVEWRDIDHSRLAMASPPSKVALFGLWVS